MDNVIKVLQSALTVVGGFLGYFIGGCDGLVIALLSFVVIDYVTGVFLAFEKKEISSEVGFHGICKKVLIFILVGVANILDVHVIQTGAILRTATIFFYLANEGISILENSSALGLPVPKKIQDALAQLRKKSEDDTDTDKKS